MEDAKTPPFVTVVIPVLNEERFILPMLESLGCLEAGGCLDTPHEIIVVDGGSTDRTLEILAGVRAEPGIKVIHNPARIQSAGVNLAAREADTRTRYMVRIDAHAVYEPGFVRKVVEALETTGAASVVVPLITRPLEGMKGFVGAVTVAQRSVLGNGGSAHRIADTPAGWVDHGHHAGFNLAFFRSIGGYDETFAVNEDAEYDVRVHKNGGRVWMEPSAVAWYSPRETARALARQYFRYGKGRASTVIKHQLMPKPRQMFPLAVLAANALGLVGGFAAPILWAVPLTYFLACSLAATRQRRRMGVTDNGYVDAEATVALMVMHMSWGLGFAYGFALSLLSKPRRPNAPEIR